MNYTAILWDSDVNFQSLLTKDWGKSLAENHWGNIPVFSWSGFTVCVPLTEPLPSASRLLLLLTVRSGPTPRSRIMTCVTAETSYTLFEILHNPDFKLKSGKWKDLDRGSQNAITERDTKHHWVQGSHGFLPQVSCQAVPCPGFARKNAVAIWWSDHRQRMRVTLWRIWLLAESEGSHAGEGRAGLTNSPGVSGKWRPGGRNSVLLFSINWHSQSLSFQQD